LSPLVHVTDPRHPATVLHCEQAGPKNPFAQSSQELFAPSVHVTEPSQFDIGEHVVHCAP